MTKGISVFTECSSIRLNQAKSLHSEVVNGFLLGVGVLLLFWTRKFEINSMYEKGFANHSTSDARHCLFLPIPCFAWPAVHKAGLQACFVNYGNYLVHIIVRPNLVNHTKYLLP